MTGAEYRTVLQYFGLSHVRAARWLGGVAAHWPELRNQGTARADRCAVTRSDSIGAYGGGFEAMTRVRISND